MGDNLGFIKFTDVSSGTGFPKVIMIPIRFIDRYFPESGEINMEGQRYVVKEDERKSFEVELLCGERKGE